MSTQQAQGQAQAQTQQEEPRAPFYLSGAMLEVIEAGLQGLPYRTAAPVLADLQKQFNDLNERAKAEHEAQLAAQVAAQTPMADEPTPMPVAEVPAPLPGTKRKVALK